MNMSESGLSVFSSWPICLHCVSWKALLLWLLIVFVHTGKEKVWIWCLWDKVWSHKQHLLWHLWHILSTMWQITGGKNKCYCKSWCHWPGCNCWPWAPARWPWWSAWGSQTPASPAESRGAWTAPAGSPGSPGGSLQNLRVREEGRQRHRKGEEVSQHRLKAHYESIIITAENEWVH